MTVDPTAIPFRSFRDQRHARLIQQAPAALLIGGGLIGAYNLLSGLLSESLLEQALPLLLIEVAIPFAGAALVRWRSAQQRIELTLLLLDMLFTTVVQLELLLPAPDPGGVSLALGLKVVGTALVFPWSPVWQAASAGYTLIAFAGGLHVGGVHLGTHAVVAPIIGSLVSIVGSMIVDGHRRALHERQIELAESEDKYRTLTEGAVAGVAVYQDEQFRFVNRAFTAMLGYARDELIGQSNYNLHRPEDRALIQQATSELLAGQRGSFETTLRAYRRDRSELYARASLTRIVYDGRPAMLAVVIDVTVERARQWEAQRLAAEVQVSEARYRDLFENATDLIIETDIEGHFVDANRAALTLAGYTKADLARGFHLKQLLPPEHLPTVQAFRAALLAGQPVQQPHTVPMIGADGTCRDIELHTRLITRPGRPPIFQSIGRDVTERQTRLIETQRMVAFQRALTAVAPTLHAPLDLGQTCSQIAHVCRDLFEVTSVRLWMRDGDTLVHRGSSNHMASSPDDWRWQLDEPVLPTIALREKRPLYVNDLTRSTWRDHFVTQLGVRAWMAVPLLSGNEGIGVLALLDYDHPNRFDDQSVEWGRIFASQAVLAIENARLRDRERAEAHTTTRLLDLAQTLHARLGDPNVQPALAIESARLLDCDISAIVTHQANHGRSRVAYVHGLAPAHRAEIEGLEFELQSTPLVRAGAHQFSRRNATAPMVRLLMERWGVEQVLYVPIHRDETFLGMLVFARRSERPFSPDHVRLAEGIAYHGATALENARLVAALQDANRVKSEFVATMSHELRSPLNVIMGYSDLLRDGQFGSVTSQQTETLSRVLQQADQLLQLINTTLDLSRLERGEVSLAHDSFALSDLLRELEAEIAPRLNAQSPRLMWQPLNGLPLLHTDRGKLKLVIRNLVDNALKFTDTGLVEVTAEQRDGVVEIRVRDTGAGIAPEALDSIFEMFRQVDASDRRSRGGVGLGLYIVRRLVTMLGGSVTVESRVGSGSTFRVTVPVCAAADCGALRTRSA